MSRMHVHIHAYVNIYVGERKRGEAVHYAVCVNDVYTGEGSSCVDDVNIGEESSHVDDVYIGERSSSI